MAKNTRSIALDNAIETELKMMLELGLTEAPISAKTLHSRLKSKGIINGQLSTLSKPDRIELIQKYKAKQIEKSGIDEVVEYTYGSVNYYKAQNKKLRVELAVNKSQLSGYTANLIEIINRVESQTPVKVEDLLLGSAMVDFGTRN